MHSFTALELGKVRFSNLIRFAHSSGGVLWKCTLGLIGSSVVDKVRPEKKMKDERRLK